MSEFCFPSFLLKLLSSLEIIFLRSQIYEAELWAFPKGILKSLGLWKKEQNFSCCGSAKLDDALSPQLVSILSRPWTEWLQILPGNEMLAVTVQAANVLQFSSDSRSQVLCHINIQYMLRYITCKCSQLIKSWVLCPKSKTAHTLFHYWLQKKYFFILESVTL